MRSGFLDSVVPALTIFILLLLLLFSAAHEYLESPRKRRRRNSDSDLYCKAKDEEIWKTEAKQKRFLGEDKYVFVQRYLENIDDACSYTTLTSDSGIRTHGAPSELGMGDIAGNFNFNFNN